MAVTASATFSVNPVLSSFGSASPSFYSTSSNFYLTLAPRDSPRPSGNVSPGFSIWLSSFSSSLSSYFSSSFKPLTSSFTFAARVSPTFFARSGSVSAYVSGAVSYCCSSLSSSYPASTLYSRFLTTASIISNRSFGSLETPGLSSSCAFYSASTSCLTFASTAAMILFY